MMMNRRILYIGNDLSKDTNSITTINTLTELLRKEGLIVIKSSKKPNKFLRIIDMCLSVIKYRKTIDFILIDTYSTINFYYAYAVSQLARFFKIKYIPILHGGNLPERLDNSKKMSNQIFCHSYKNIAPSGYLKYEFEKRGYSSELIPNVISIQEYPFLYRNKLQPKLLYVRAFAKIYNPTMAIELLFKLKKEYPNATLCMVGPDRDGSLSEVKALIKKYGLVNDVEFTGMLTKKEWHKKAKGYDFFINTTNFDNTPVSVMEAMALGLFVVSTNVGGIPYLLKNGKEGFLVEKGNINEMKNAIVSALNTDEDILKIMYNARKKVEHFDWEVVKYEWNKLLNNEL